MAAILKKEKKSRKKTNPRKRGRKPIEDIQKYEEESIKFQQQREDLIKNCFVLTEKGRMKLKNQISAMKSRVRIKKEAE